MEYLAKNKIIHRDLATRNVLVRKHDHIEVADFGLASLRKTKGDFMFHPKWASIELLTNEGGFSEASDVWAFGVTMWEIMNFGTTPYSDIKGNGQILNAQMWEFLKNGDRLNQPLICSEEFYLMMFQC
jgi:serine/threonine protein kinase